MGASTQTGISWFVWKSFHPAQTQRPAIMPAVLSGKTSMKVALIFPNDQYGREVCGHPTISSVTAESPRRIHKPEREGPLLHLLRNLPPSCGMLCATDYIGSLACNVARLLGPRVPQDLAIACIGNNVVSRISSPPLTGIVPDGRLVGRAACRLLVKLLAARARTPEL